MMMPNRTDSVPEWWWVSWSVIPWIAQSVNVPFPLYLTPARFLIKFSLVVNGLNTNCVCEKLRPPMDQLSSTWPMYSSLASFWAKILVNSLMFSTRTPGGDSCSAIVSEVSMVKNTLMGHSMFLLQPC